MKRVALTVWKQRLAEEEAYGVEAQMDLAAWLLEEDRFVYEDEDEVCICLVGFRDTWLFIITLSTGKEALSK